MTSKRTQIWVTVCVGLLCVSGCSSPISAAQSQQIDVSQAKLTDVVAALQLYPLRGTNKQDSYMALISKDGSYKLIREGAMFSQIPIWNEEGLFFADSEKDYLIPANRKAAQTQNTPKKAQQDGGISLTNGSIISTYQGSFDDNGYMNVQFGLKTPGKSQIMKEQKAASVVSSLAACGNDAYAVVAPLTTDAAPSLLLYQVAANNEIHVIEKAKIHTAEQYSEKEENWAYGGEVQVDDTFPCMNSEIYMISSNLVPLPQRDGLKAEDSLDNSAGALRDTTPLVGLGRWNVKTKKLTTTQLFLENGKPLRNEEYGSFSFVSIDAAMLKQRKILFTNTTYGNIYSADTNTGKVTVLHETKDPGGPEDAKYTMRVTAKAVYLLSTPLNSHGGKMYIQIFDRKTMKLKKRINVSKDFNNVMQNDDYQPGFGVINPQEPAVSW